MGKMKRVSKAQWVEAAVDVLETEGIAGVRVEVLAKRLGISKSGFYWHFENQQELFTEILDYWSTEITEVLATNPEVRQLAPKERLTRIAETIVDFGLARYEASITQWALQDKTAARRFKSVNRMRLDFVRAAFEELGFGSDDLEMRARLFTCYVTWEGPMFPDMPRKRRHELIARYIELMTSR